MKPPMGTTLTTFMVALAIEPEKFSEFVVDPEAAAEKAGLSKDDRAVLLCGDQSRIYAALMRGHGKD